VLTAQVVVGDDGWRCTASSGSTAARVSPLCSKHLLHICDIAYMLLLLLLLLQAACPPWVPQASWEGPLPHQA
jgi:hypothetical protein